MKDILPIKVDGHVHIQDDIGNVLLDKNNAVHTQNVSRVIARALANESNYYIHRIAYGNGGTSVDAAFQVTFKTPNDGLSPDLQEWRSRLYNETYSEIVDDSSVNIGVDPGSAGPAVGTRAGGGSVPSGDPTTVEHVSGPGVRSQELGAISQVVITSTLNPAEPLGQIDSDIDPNPETSGDAIENTEGSFVFDEIGLYTTGANATDSSGYQQIDLGVERNSEDDTQLNNGSWYNLQVAIGSSGSPVTFQNVTFQVPSGSPGTITFGDVCEAINTSNASWGTPTLSGGFISITDNTDGTYPTIAGASTFGYLQINDTANTGDTSAVTIGVAGSNGLGSADGSSAANAFDLLTELSASLLTSVDGTSAGIQNNPTSSSLERERLLTHVIFSPVTKTANRTLTITYTLTVSVARST